MIQVDKETRGFRPTIEWMSIKYDEMNQELFHNSLGECNFEIFTTGRGSQGRTLGKFYMNAELKYERRSLRMYKLINFDKTYINSDNFYTLCKPTISLNGNYSGTEYGFLATLVHEMCHYYTYMNGYVPSRGHGAEFYNIGNRVTYESDGLFTIQRLASAEDMSHLDLDDDMKAKKEKRIANKKASIFAVFDIRSDSDIRLTMTSSQALIDKISNFDKANSFSRKVIITNDPGIINNLFELGYRKNMRTWRYWPMSNKLGLIDMLNNIDEKYKKVEENPRYMNENRQKRNIDNIISETLNRLISERMDDESFDITPDMDLGAYSPLEIE